MIVRPARMERLEDLWLLWYLEIVSFESLRIENP